MAIFFVRQTALIGMGTDFVLETEDLKITFNAFDKYWKKTGCKPTGCSGKSACRVWGEVIDYEFDCTIEQCYGEGWRDCDSIASRSNCMYGENCDERTSTSRGDYCESHCSWIDGYDLGTYGGAIYDSYDNCAWYILVKDKEGNLIKELSAQDKYGEDWEKDKYYREAIDFKYEGTSIKTISDHYGIVQRRADGSSIKSCISVKFQVEDDRYRYNVCLGNDGLDEPDCIEPVTLLCKLGCPEDKELDYDSCTCVEPQPECISDSDCSEGFFCVNDECTLEEEPPEEEPPEQEPEEPFEFKLTNTIIIIILFILMLITFSILFNRNRKTKKKR